MEISLQSVASTLRVTGGRDIGFTRAKLIMHNKGPADVDGFVPTRHFYRNADWYMTHPRPSAGP